MIIGTITMRNRVRKLGSCENIAQWYLIVDILTRLTTLLPHLAFGVSLEIPSDPIDNLVLYVQIAPCCLPPTARQALPGNIHCVAAGSCSVATSPSVSII